MSVTQLSITTTETLLQYLEDKPFKGLETQRAAARKHLRTLGLPSSKSEEYKHTPITRLLDKNFDLGNIKETPGTIASLDAFSIQNLDVYTVVFVNGIFDESLSTLKTVNGLTWSTMQEAATTNADLLDKHVGTYADASVDALTAWNAAAWSEGLFLAIDNKVTIGKPILVHHIIDASSEQVIDISRNLILVGTNSDVTIIHKFDSQGSNNHFSNIVTEIVVAENAGVNFYQLQNDSGKQYQFNQTTVHQTNASRANAYTFTLSGELIRNNLQLLLNGEGCESHMYGLYLLNNKTIADNHTVADHQKPNSFSNELYKGILDGNSKGIFNGKIYVRPQAQKTNAFQTNRNIILSEGASINTKPQLEIWADDVKCSHGCTTGQLDEEALFYLQSRGIEKDMAQGMLLTAFAGEVTDNIKIPALKEYCEAQISARLHKPY